MNLKLNTIPILYTLNVALSFDAFFVEGQNCVMKYYHQECNVSGMQHWFCHSNNFLKYIIQ